MLCHCATADLLQAVPCLLAGHSGLIVSAILLMPMLPSIIASGLTLTASAPCPVLMTIVECEEQRI